MKRNKLPIRKKKDSKIFEKNNPTIALNVLYVKIEYISCQHLKAQLKTFKENHSYNDSKRKRVTLTCIKKTISILTLFWIKGQKGPLPVFSLISTKNFLIFSFNSFATLAYNFKGIPSGSPKSLKLNHKHLLKN